MCFVPVSASPQKGAEILLQALRVEPRHLECLGEKIEAGKVDIDRIIFVAGSARDLDGRVILFDEQSFGHSLFEIDIWVAASAHFLCCLGSALMNAVGKLCAYVLCSLSPQWQCFCFEFRPKLELAVG